MRVVKNKIGNVNEDRAIRRLRGDGKTPQYRLIGILTRCAKSRVGLDKQHLGTAALEADDAAFGSLSAIESQVIGAGAVRQAVGIKQIWTGAIRVKMRNFEIELSCLRVPIKRQETVKVLHARGFCDDRRRRRGAGWGGSLRDVADGKKQEGKKWKGAHVIFYHVLRVFNPPFEFPARRFRGHLKNITGTERGTSRLCSERSVGFLFRYLRI
jgi:hypothetical protein